MYWRCARVDVLFNPFRVFMRAPYNGHFWHVHCCYNYAPMMSCIIKGQSVMVLGMGNAAMETADAVAQYANYVHVIPGRVHAWQSGPGWFICPPAHLPACALIEDTAGRIVLALILCDANGG